jgi:diguanylate cyclase (GGDEF)-like protein
LEYIAARDPLTDLLNRRAFFSQIERIAAANHGQRVLAAILLDIDNFKRINDGHGHLTGDQALKRVAENIQGNIRRGDLACRFGGDEFAVFITTKSGEEAKHFAERLRASFNADPIPMGADQVPIRASFGVALHFEGDFNIEALLEQADQALYSAKADGKDRIKIFSN